MEYSIKVNVIVTFKAFNVFNGLFFYRLKSNVLENFTDQRLAEVTFEVTINVQRKLLLKVTMTNYARYISTKD